MSIGSTVAEGYIAKQKLGWNKYDTLWMLGLYGTAVGAGTLFLPIAASGGGIWPLILISLLVFPMTFYSHRAFSRFFLASSEKATNISEVAEEHFGKFASNIITIFYFLSIYPVLLMYSVAITNTTESFLVNQCGLTAPPRVLTSIVLLLALTVIIRVGHLMILKSMRILVYPFISVLIFFSLYLVPYWHVPSLDLNSIALPNMMMSLYLLVPVMIFSFNHSCIISTFSQTQKKHYGDMADQKCAQILKSSHLLMFITVIFFVLSCVLSLTPAELSEAKEQNLSILSFLANHLQVPLLAWLAPIVAFIAISKSFLGHYIGAAEGLSGMFLIFGKKAGTEKSNDYRLQLGIDLFIIGSCWLVATLNPGILSMIQILNGPILALILFLLPMYALKKVPALKRFQNRYADLFITVMGLLGVSAMLFGVFHHIS